MFPITGHQKPKHLLLLSLPYFLSLSSLPILSLSINGANKSEIPPKLLKYAPKMFWIARSEISTKIPVENFSVGISYGFRRDSVGFRPTEKFSDGSFSIGFSVGMSDFLQRVLAPSLFPSEIRIIFVVIRNLGFCFVSSVFAFEF